MTTTSLGVKVDKEMAEYELQKTEKAPLRTVRFLKGTTDTSFLCEKKVYPAKKPFKRLTATNEIMISEFATKADVDDAKIQILTWGTLFFIACTPTIIGVLRYVLG